MTCCHGSTLFLPFTCPPWVLLEIICLSWQGSLMLPFLLWCISNCQYRDGAWGERELSEVTRVPPYFAPLPPRHYGIPWGLTRMGMWGRWDICEFLLLTNQYSLPVTSDKWFQGGFKEGLGLLTQGEGKSMTNSHKSQLFISTYSWLHVSTFCTSWFVSRRLKGTLLYTCGVITSTPCSSV